MRDRLAFSKGVREKEGKGERDFCEREKGRKGERGIKNISPSHPLTLSPFRPLALSLILLLALLPSMTARAQFGGLTKTGMSAATFLSIEVGPRAKAMGGAFTGRADDASALYWNPSGLAHLQNNTLIASHAEWLADINFDFIGIALPVEGFGTLGASITSLTMPEMRVRTVLQPEGTGELFNASDLAIGLSYARALTGRFAIGANFKYIRQKIYNSTAQTIAFDFGGLFRSEFRGLSFGMSISNFGGDMKLDGTDTQVEVDISPNEFGNNDRVFANLETEDFQLPLTLRMGIAMDLIQTMPNRLTVAVDGVVPNDNAQYLNVGAEYAFRDLLALRAGYRTLFLEDSEEGLTLGVGFHYELFANTALGVDYSFTDFGILENVHEVALIIAF